MKKIRTAFVATICLTSISSHAEPIEILGQNVFIKPHETASFRVPAAGTTIFEIRCYLHSTDTESAKIFYSMSGINPNKTNKEGLILVDYNLSYMFNLTGERIKSGNNYAPALLNFTNNTSIVDVIVNCEAKLVN